MTLGKNMGIETEISEKIVVALQPPKMWKVVILNDDTTPMELVIDILESIFRYDEASAKALTLEIHNSGSAVAGVFSFEIAETKALESTHMATQNGATLKITVEEE